MAANYMGLWNETPYLTGTSLHQSVACETLSQEALPCWCRCYACIPATQVLDNRQSENCSFSEEQLCDVQTIWWKTMCWSNRSITRKQCESRAPILCMWHWLRWAAFCSSNKPGHQQSVDRPVCLCTNKSSPFGGCDKPYYGRFHLGVPKVCGKKRTAIWNYFRQCWYVQTSSQNASYSLVFHSSDKPVVRRLLWEACKSCESTAEEVLGRSMIWKKGIRNSAYWNWGPC